MDKKAKVKESDCVGQRQGLTLLAIIIIVQFRSVGKKEKLKKIYFSELSVVGLLSVFM